MNTGSTTAETGAARFSRHVAWTFGARILVAGSSLLSGITIARWLGAGGVGVWAALNVITLLSINLGGLGLPSAITFLVARDKLNTKPILLNAIVFGLIAGSVTAGIIIVIAMARPGLLGDVPTRLLTIAALALPAQMLSYMSLAVFLGLERIRAYNVVDICLQGIILLNAVLILLVLGLGISELVTVGACANVAAGVAITVLLARAVRSTGGSWRFDSRLMNEMLRYGVRFLVAMVAGLVILRGDLLIVNYFRDSGDAGVYAVSTQVATFLQMIPAVVSTILFSRTAGAGDETGAMTCRVTRHATFILLVICLAAVPAAFVLPVLYGPAFAAVPGQFLILLPGVFLLGIETIQVQHFTGLGLPRAIPAFWVAVMLLALGLNLVLVPKFGAYGAAVTSTAAYVAIFILVAMYFRSKTGRSFSEMFILRRAELGELFDSVLLQLRPREGKV